MFYFWLCRATSLQKTFLRNLKTIMILRPMESPFNLYYERGARDVCNAYVLCKSVAGWLQTTILVSITYVMKFLYELRTLI